MKREAKQAIYNAILSGDLKNKDIVTNIKETTHKALPLNNINFLPNELINKLLFYIILNTCK